MFVKMRIRRFQSADTKETVELFRDTVRQAACGDYSPQQVLAWAPDAMDLDAFRLCLLEGQTYVAEGLNGTLLGFIAFDRDGHIDMLYAHTNHQRQGIGSRLLALMIREASELGLTKVSTEASLSARPFFEKHGFAVHQQNEFEIRGVHFINYNMEKRL